MKTKTQGITRLFSKLGSFLKRKHRNPRLRIPVLPHHGFEIAGRG